MTRCFDFLPGKAIYANYHFMITKGSSYDHTYELLFG